MWVLVLSALCRVYGLMPGHRLAVQGDLAASIYRDG